MTCRVVNIREEHVSEVVRLHMQSFPDFFLTALGPGFLREFYASFLVDEAGIGCVAESALGTPIGVAVGPLTPDGYYSRLLRRRWWAFAAAGCRRLLIRPGVAKRLVRGLSYRGDPPEGPPRALLSSLAVRPETQGAGVGKALVKHWLEEVHRRGGTGCYLSTDRDENTAVNRFYRRLGWELESTYATPEGRRMNRYVFDFAVQTHSEEGKWQNAA
jgi:ribosomal protein S18 acetylase RimI-like enzyme